MVCVDLEVVAALDQNLDRIGVISGASIYPLVWNILLAARNEGYGGTITTMAVAEEPRSSRICWACRSHMRSPQCCRWVSRANS